MKRWCKRSGAPPWDTNALAAHRQKQRVKNNNLPRHLGMLSRAPILHSHGEQGLAVSPGRSHRTVGVTGIAKVRSRM